MDRVEPGFTSLPLLLSRGPQTLVSELRQWLQSSFDCHITPHCLESDDLCLLLGQFATAEKSESYEIDLFPEYIVLRVPRTLLVAQCHVLTMYTGLGGHCLSHAGGRGLGGVELVYKTPPTVTQEGKIMTIYRLL